MRIRPVLIASAALALALPALAQEAAQPPHNPTQYPAPAYQTTLTPGPAPTPTPAPTRPSSAAPSGGGADETAVEELSNLELEPPAPPVEYPGWARRDPWVVGRLDPTEI